jgi:alanyl-tRNA synthetase
VSKTGDIGLVTLLGESAVSSGVRRVEALTGNAAREYLQAQDAKLREAAAVLKSAPADVPSRVAALIEDRKKLERELADARKAIAMGGGSGGDASAPKKIGDVSFVGRIVEGISAKELKGVVDEEKQRLGSGVVALAAKSDDGKAAIVVGVTDDLTDKCNAVDLVRVASEAVGGKGGGGRPDMAQAGGPDGGKLEAALQQIEATLAG